MTLAAAALLVLALGAAESHVGVRAELRQGSAGPEVAVTFAPRDHDIKVNRSPAPRLALEPEQKRLSLKPRKAEKKEGYLDTTFPVVFPVEVLPGGRTPATVKGTVTYYYCSKAAGWCRKGTEDVLLSVP